MRKVFASLLLLSFVLSLNPQKAEAVAVNKRQSQPTMSGFFLQKTMTDFLLPQEKAAHSFVQNAQSEAKQLSPFSEDLIEEALSGVGLKPTKAITPKHPLFEKKPKQLNIGDIVFLSPVAVSYPMQGNLITKGYPKGGEFKKSSPFAEERGKAIHLGEDFFGIIGAAVIPIVDGVVEFVGRSKDVHERYLGYEVVVSCGNYTFYFGHLQEGSSKLKKGDIVKAGETVLGKQGGTGYKRDYQDHLHLEITYNGNGAYNGNKIEKFGRTYIEPTEFIKKLQNQTYTVGIYAGDDKVIKAGSKEPVKVAQKNVIGAISLASLFNTPDALVAINTPNEKDPYDPMALAAHLIKNSRGRTN